jgi:hypothetical protein
VDEEQIRDVVLCFPEGSLKKKLQALSRDSSLSAST